MIFDSVENKRTTYCGLIDDKFLDQPVCIYGWVHRRRDHGGVIFLDIRDREDWFNVFLIHHMILLSSWLIKSEMNLYF